MGKYGFPEESEFPPGPVFGLVLGPAARNSAPKCGKGPAGGGALLSRTSWPNPLSTGSKTGPKTGPGRI